MNSHEFGRPGGTVPVTVITNSPNSRRLTSQRMLRVLLSPTRVVLVVNIWKSYIWTAVKDVNIKAILAVMKCSAPVSQRSWVQISYRPEFYSGLLFITTAKVAFIFTRMALPVLPNHNYNLWPNRWGFCPLRWRLFDRKSTSCGRSFVLSLPSNQLLSYRLVCLPELRAMTDLIKTVDLRVDQLCEATNALSPMRLLLSTFFGTSE